MARLCGQGPTPVSPITEAPCHFLAESRTIQTILSQLLQEKPTAVKREILVVWLRLRADIFHREE